MEILHSWIICNFLHLNSKLFQEFIRLVLILNVCVFFFAYRAEINFCLAYNFSSFLFSFSSPLLLLSLFLSLFCTAAIAFCGLIILICKLLKFEKVIPEWLLVLSHFFFSQWNFSSFSGLVHLIFKEGFRYLVSWCDSINILLEITDWIVENGVILLKNKWLQAKCKISF